MANTDYNTILLYSPGTSPLLYETSTAATITPGHLVARNSSNLILKHAVDGGPTAKTFAVEDKLMGGTIDTVYAASSKLFVRQVRRGDKVLAWLANTVVATIGAGLTSNADGTLRLHLVTDDIASLVGQALEAVDASGGTKRIIVEIQ